MPAYSPRVTTDAEPLAPAHTAPVAFAGAVELARRIAAGETSAVAVLEVFLERIAAHDAALNAFSVVLDSEARAEAAERDRALASGAEPGPLHGVPVAIKEEIDVAGCVTTFGGRANSTPAREDGEVVRRLRAAGAVIIGKTQMPEFGAWPFTESVAYGITRNPWDPNRTPGGSSGGTAAAVAAGLVPVAIGGDGGGSIRIPSACCGLFGLKPQRGRVTSYPMPHLWWALGTVGPLTRSVADSALVYDVIRGSMPGDLFAAGEPVSSFSEAAGSAPTSLRIGWSTKSAAKGVRPDPEHVAAVRATADLLAGLGHTVEEVRSGLPDVTSAFIPQFFAGIRTEADLVEDRARLEPRTKQVARLGAWVRQPVIDWALRQTEKLSARTNRIFETYDVLLTPAIAHRPPRAGVLDGAGAVRALLRSLPMVAYAAIWNIAGNPAASVPAGFGEDGLPLAVQLVGRTDDETTLLSLAAQIEIARPWAARTPSL